MSRKSKILPHKTLNSQPLSSASLTSKITTVKEVDVVEIDLDWSGAIATQSGTISVEATLSEDKDDPSAVWIPLDFGTTVAISRASGKHQIVIQQVSFLHIRLIYTRTDILSTGTLSSTVFGTTKGA